MDSGSTKTASNALPSLRQNLMCLRLQWFSLLFEPEYSSAALKKMAAANARIERLGLKSYVPEMTLI